MFYHIWPLTNPLLSRVEMPVDIALMLIDLSILQVHVPVRYLGHSLSVVRVRMGPGRRPSTAYATIQASHVSDTPTITTCTRGDPSTGHGMMYDTRQTWDVCWEIGDGWLPTGRHRGFLSRTATDQSPLLRARVPMSRIGRLPLTVIATVMAIRYVVDHGILVPYARWLVRDVPTSPSTEYLAVLRPHLPLPAVLSNPDSGRDRYTHLPCSDTEHRHRICSSERPRSSHHCCHVIAKTPDSGVVRDLRASLPDLNQTLNPRTINCEG